MGKGAKGSIEANRVRIFVCHRGLRKIDFEMLLEAFSDRGRNLLVLFFRLRLREISKEPI